MENDHFSWLTAMGFAFLTFNSGMAIYRSKGDAGSVAFVAVSYLDLLSLFYCLRLYEKSQQDDPSKRKIIKVIVWSLTTLLTVMFSYKVAALMPLPVAVIVWAMASATILGGFYAFFFHQEVAGK
jgi:FlaA1/EpsC-like NDP-sugar epimerase